MASSQTIAEAVENSLNAYNIISKKHLESVSYDTTVKAKIVDIKNRNFGEYKVNDGTSIYYAYSDKTDYYNGQMVWVVIPNGDYSQQKIIQGKYIESDNSEPFAYVSPLNSFVDMTQNLIEPGMVNETGLIANKSAVSEITLWAIFGRAFTGYDKLAIQAGFKSWLKSLNVYTGEYGLRLDIVSNIAGTSQTSNNRKIYQIYLNTDDFYGDVYNFETFYSQVKVIDISMIDCIESMSLIFYQSNNFQDSQGNFIPVTNFDNIWVKNPYISLGFDASKFTTDTVLLSTADSITYAPFLSERAKQDMVASLDPDRYEVGSSAYTEMATQIMSDSTTISQILNKLNTKNMTANYIHIDEDGKAVVYGPSVGFTEDMDYNQLPEGAVVHWYQWTWEEGTNDKLAGPYWKEVTDKIETADKLKYNNFVPDITRQSERFKVIIEYPSREKAGEDVYNAELFNRQSEYKKDEQGNKKKIIDHREHQNKESFYDWVIEGLDLIEDTKRQAIYNLNDSSYMREAEAALYQEYLRALNGLDPSKAAADDINIEYRKKIMNIKTDMQSEITEYSDLYNEIVGILGEAVTYTSAVLEFTNEEEVANAASIGRVKGLYLEVDDDYHGNYHIYDEQGTIISKSESQKKRTITAKWNETIISGERGDGNIETIEWRIPIKNTMIVYPEQGVEYTEYERISFDTGVDFMSYPYALYRWDNNEKEYVELDHREIDGYQQEFYRNTLCKHREDDISHSYFSIIRPIQNFEEHEIGTEEASLSGQVFRIKESYNENLINNTIKCIVTKNSVEYEAEFTLTFGPTGTAGTDFTFELEFASKIPALTLQKGSTITVIPHLYDYENKDVITDYLSSLKYGWYSPRDLDGTINEEFVIDSNTGKTNITINAENPSMEQVQYYILGASVDVSNINGKKITLKTNRPVPVRINESYVSIDGADRIAYNSRGTDPSYYKDPYKLYTYRDKATVEVDNVKWKVVYKDGDDTEQYYPTLTDKYNLVPLSIYLRDSVREVAVNCLDGQNNILWTQPLYIYQNEYTSALLNSWDGSLTFDEENGIILSRTVGAGSKDGYNRYQGVIMGDIAPVDNTPVYGLYGYDEGVQSFGFKIDGTAFIGKSGKGQINFDGNSGQISSLSYNINQIKPTGMLIDLDDGTIDMKGAIITKINFLENKTTEKEILTEVINDNTLAEDIRNEAIIQYNKLIEDAERQYNLQMALAMQRAQSLRKIEEYENGISQTNIWDAQAANASILNRIEEERQKAVAAAEALYMAQIEHYTDEEVYNYLKDNGTSDLVNDSLFVPVYTSNNSAVRVSVTNPYFVVTSDDGVDLIRIANDAYHLQTNDYEEGTINNDAVTKAGKGLKINLEDGFIDGYNFRLRGVNSSETKLNGSFFELNSNGNPFIKVHYVNNGDNDDDTVADLRNRGYLGSTESLIKNLFLISDNDFILQSKDYFACEFETSAITNYRLHEVDPTQAGEGLLLDLQNGKLEGHNFQIISVNSEYSKSGNTITYNRNAGSYIEINSSGDPYFRIHYQYIEDGTETPINGYTKWNILTKDDRVFVNKNVDLINISNSAFDIYSRDFQEPGTKGVYKDKIQGSDTYVVSNLGSVGRGIHFDLSGNSIIGLDGTKQIKGSIIEAYSFLLDAYRPDLIYKDVRSRIRINSAATGKSETALYNIVPDQDFLLAYPEYTEDDIQKQIDDRRKEHPDEAFSTSVENISPAGSVKVVTGVDHDDPLILGGLFSVSWSGKVTANYLVAKQGGRIGPYIIKSTALYSNNGKLYNGQPYYDSDGNINQELDPQGVYLGFDGLSVRDKFVVYKNPINRMVGKSLTPNNSSNLAENNTLSNESATYRQNHNMNNNHALMKPIGYDVKNKKTLFAKEYDFVTSGNYERDSETGALLKDDVVSEYFSDGKTYAQTFYTSEGTKMVLGDLSFFLNGNSVLNGKTALNGNTYIFGNLQVGEYKTLGETLDQTTHFATLYANTTVYGIFRTTGMTFIGDESGKWQDNESDLRENKDTPNSRTKTNDDNLGAIIYRNTYITGYLKIGGGLVVGDFDYIKNQTKYDNTYLTSDFTAYVKNAKFFGDLEVAAGFIAGTKSQAKPYSSDFPTIPWCDKNGNATDPKPGSGIQARYIFLGRDPNYIKDDPDHRNQSTLQIYANTIQWGNFIAGNRGSKVELYANASEKEGSSAAFIKMSQGSGISIQTGKGNPFELKTNGGNISIDGSDGDEGASVVEIKAGQYDYIKFQRGSENNKSTYTLNINSNGTVKLSGGHSAYVQINSNGVTIHGGNNTSTNSNNITTPIYGVIIKGHTKVEGTLTTTGTTTIGGTAYISNNCYITGNVYAANLHLDSNGVKMDNTSYTPAASENGLSFRGNGANNTSLWLGGWTVIDGNLQSSVSEPAIKLVPLSATIYFGNDYVDGAGSGGTNSKGLRLYGEGSIHYNAKTSHLFRLNGTTMVSIQSSKMVISENVSIGHGASGDESSSETATTYTFTINGKPLGKLAYANYVKKKITVDLSRTLGTNLANTKQLYVISDDDGTYYKHGDAVTYYTYSDSGYYYRAAYDEYNSYEFVRADSINIKPVYVYRVKKTGGTSTSFWWSKTYYEVDDIVYISEVEHVIVSLVWSLYSSWSATNNVYLASSNPTSVSKPTSLTTVNTYKWVGAGSDVHKIESVRIKGSSKVIMEGVKNESDETETVTLSYTTLKPES